MIGKKHHLTSGLAKLGGKVILRLRSVTIPRTSMHPIVGSDKPNGVQLNPHFDKPPRFFMQAEESIVLQELCYYCKDGVLAKRKLGNVILTNKRFIIVEIPIPKVSFALIVIPILIVVGVLIEMLPPNMEFLWKVLITAISGGIIGRISLVISKHLIKNKRESNELPTSKIIASIVREDIAGAEKEIKGIRKMLVVKHKDGTLYKFSVKDKDSWLTELQKN